LALNGTNPYRTLPDCAIMLNNGPLTFSMASTAIDTVAPAAPAVNGVAPLTNNNKPLISGTAEANATLTIYDGTAVLGTTHATGTGAWSFTPAAALADGPHNFTATATDAAGNANAPAAFTLVLRVSGDPWNGPPQFTVFVDGTQVGGTFSTSASHDLN